MLSNYYQPAGQDAYNLTLMRRIDEQFAKRPSCGVPRMMASLWMMGYGVNPKRVRRLMRVMGLEAIYPKPRQSVNRPDHKVYPYLLKGVPVERPDQAWATDITYPIFVERLWRSVKYEEIYLRDYQTVPSARIHLSDYFEFYNNERPHETLGYRTPHEVYFGARAALTPASEAGV